MNDKLFTLIIFIVCYVLILSRKLRPVLVAFSGALVLFITGIINIEQALGSINYNVLGVFIGTMTLSGLFIHSQVPAYLAARLVNKSQRVGVALLFVCLLSGFISSFTENVATVLIITPIAFEIASVLEISPVSLLIGIALSANLQGCATMIGDSPSIILALESGMNFNDFFWMPAAKTGVNAGKLGIFFAVQLGAVVSFYILWRVFRKYRQKPKLIKIIKPKSWAPTLFLIFMVLSLVFSSFLQKKPPYTIAGICIFWALVGLLWYEASHKEKISLIKDIDWENFFFLIGIFILVGSLSSSGIIEDIAGFISRFSASNALFAYILIVAISVVVSAFVDNIPYTIAMIPAIKIVAANLGVSMYPFLFGLLIGTCLGGNITPIGASCNVVVVGLLRKKGYHVKFNDFFRLGFPFTIAAVLVGAWFIWSVWM